MTTVHPPLPAEVLAQVDAMVERLPPLTPAQQDSLAAVLAQIEIDAAKR